MKKKLVAVLAVVGLTATSVLSFNINDIICANAVDGSGYCGDNVLWTLEGNTLTLSGSGDMYDYITYARPWQDSDDSIEYIEVSYGITYIGQNVFSEMPYLVNCTIPSSVETIAENAFNGSTDLLNIELVQDSYAETYADYNGIQYSYMEEKNTEIFTEGSDATNSIGGELDTETNEYQEVETDDKGYIVVVPYAGAAGADELPADGGLPLDDDVLSTEDTMEATSEEATGNKNLEEATAAVIPERDKTSISSDRISWSLENGVLTLTGSGDMEDYKDAKSTPWYTKRNQITEVVVGNNITGIGSYAFAKCKNLETVTLPSTLCKIDSHAFYDCQNMSQLTIPSSVMTIESNSVGYIYDTSEKKVCAKKAFVIYGEAGSQAEQYASDNSIVFVKKIQPSSAVHNENDTQFAKGMSFRYKLIFVTIASVVVALISGLVYYAWQNKGGIEKLNRKDKENGSN